MYTADACVSAGGRSTTSPWFPPQSSPHRRPTHLMAMPTFIPAPKETPWREDSRHLASS
jgi:hypothetical protein